MKKNTSNVKETKAINYKPLLCGVNSHGKLETSENWKDCHKCGSEMTYGKLITNERYCWNCNHKSKK